MRIGTGYDIHRLVEDRRLVLGGVEIPYHKGLLGHSDADVLSHAIADAILGAAGLHDIGHFFPDTDPKLEGIDSQIILRKAIAEVSHLGYKLQNVDSTLIAQEPKIGPHINSMKRVLSNSLGVTEDSIGIKATTNEGVGDIGKGLAIAAQAACLLVN
ncbi:MAG: 2-C-methyl-D-erythritol 2,4-cyclodiphosphate synthase [Opitutae bacterium]